MREQEFKDWMELQGYSDRTISTCVSDAKRVEKDEGLNLDEEFEKDRLESLIRLYNPTPQDEREGNVPKMKIVPKTKKDRSLSQLLSGYRNTLSNNYRRFCYSYHSVFEEPDNKPNITDPNASTTFGLEADLQYAIRGNIDQLDPNLEIIDGGTERKVATGKIDILAKDNKGDFVVIELKAGRAQDGVIAQILGYMGDIAKEENKPVRGIIVAAGFSNRLETAAETIENLELKTYAYNFEFN